jgi:hypothetical protein
MKSFVTLVVGDEGLDTLAERRIARSAISTVAQRSHSHEPS